jgi:hypothetical protein
MPPIANATRRLERDAGTEKKIATPTLHHAGQISSVLGSASCARKPRK